jgi:hypothetical protein
MKIKLTFGILAVALALASIITLPSARADEWDQATKITFSQPVQIPGRVLPAGTYWFVLFDSSSSSRNIVQVFNADRSIVYGTFHTVATESATIPDNTAITFAERQPMQPETIVSWFYPGEATGHEFLYPKQEERELAQAKQHTVVAKSLQKGQNAVVGY